MWLVWQTVNAPSHLGAYASRGLGCFEESRRLSIAKLTLGQEAYYEQQVARGLDDYYAGRGESPGIWAGRGAAELELVGVVENGDLGTLLRGLNPANEMQLRKQARVRTITVRTLDIETGEWRCPRTSMRCSRTSAPSWGGRSRSRPVSRSAG